MQCQINNPVHHANQFPRQSLETANNGRPRFISCRSLSVRLCNVRDVNTLGRLDSHRCFITVCENIDRILKIVYEVLLQLHKAACRLLQLQSSELKCTQPLPDLLKDLQPTKMTLRNNNPDVIPYASRRCLTNHRHDVNNRPRDDQNLAVHSPCDLSDSHNSDNRHYYHHGHHRHNHHTTNNNKNSHHSEEDDNGNSIHPQMNSNIGQNTTRHSFHLRSADIQNNNAQTRPQIQNRSGLADITNQELSSQPAISIQVADVNGNHGDDNGFRRTVRQSRRCLMVPDFEDDVHQGDNLGQPSPFRHHSPLRSVGPMRQLSPVRTPSPCRHGMFDTGMPDQAAGMLPELLSDSHEHESTKDIILALRSIGDNLEHKIKHHNQPSVQAIFGGKNIHSQLLALVLRQRNVMGWALNASLRLLLLYSQL